MSVARSSAPAAVRRGLELVVADVGPAVGSSTLTAPPVDLPHVVELASRSRHARTLARCAGVSATTARAPESERIHSTCSADEVS